MTTAGTFSPTRLLLALMGLLLVGYGALACNTQADACVYLKSGMTIDPEPYHIGPNS